MRLAFLHFRMRESHAVEGLPVVPGDDSNGTGRRTKRARRSAVGPEVLSALPDDGSRRRGVTFVHKGSHKDGEGTVPPALQEALANMSDSLSRPLCIEEAWGMLRRQRKDSQLTIAVFLCAVLPCKGGIHIPKAHSVAAHLVGMSARTVSNIVSAMRKRGNLPVRARGAGGRPRREDRPMVRERPSEDGNHMEFEDLLVDVAPSEVPPSGEQQVMAPVPQPIAEFEPDPIQIGLKLAALVARIYVDPVLPLTSFTSFVSLMDAFAPGSVGDLNHSHHFALGLGQCMVAHVQLCAALEHWARVPALAIPSDFARVLDGYTCEGEACQILLHIVTHTSGELDWLLIDVVPNASARDMGSEDRIHKFKAAAPTVSLLRRVERNRVALTDRDARARHAVTCGDGAYIGPYSIHLMQEWQKQVPDPGRSSAARSGSAGGSASSAAGSANSAAEPAALGDEAKLIDLVSAAVSQASIPSSPSFLEAMCEFHAVQRVGRDSDAMFRTAGEFDTFLRDVKTEFQYGSRLYVRGAWKQLKMTPRKLLAPRADGFKVTVYARDMHTRHAYNFAMLNIALSAKLHALYHNLKVEAWSAYDKKRRHSCRDRSTSHPASRAQGLAEAPRLAEK